jgi:hypothetical protein
VPLRRPKRRQQEPGQLDHRDDVQLVGLTPVFRRHRRQRAQPGDARRVDDDVQAVQAGGRRRQRGGVGQLDRPRSRRRQLGGQRLQRVHVAAAEQ